MQLAYEEALLAKGQDEVPVGAVLVYQGKVIAKAHNLRNQSQSSLAHAEILVIEEGCKIQGSWRLEDCDLYVTLEPCPMCAGAIIQARIKRVFFGAYDPKGGCFGSVMDFNQIAGFNHYPEVHGGILEKECATLLSDFFREKRQLSK